MKVKKITLILALFMVLVCCLGAVSAAEDAGSDVAASDDVSVDEAVGEIDSNDESISANEQADNVDDTNSALSAQQNNDTSSEPILEEQNNQEPLKSGTKTVDVTSYEELVNTINSAVEDSENNIYIINLNSGSYKKPTTTLNPGNYHPKIIINGNHQILYDNPSIFGTLDIKNMCEIEINNLTFRHGLKSYVNLFLDNVTLYSTMTSYSGNNLTIQNMILTKKITNNGNLIIGENVSFNGGSIGGSGKVITDDEEAILPYMTAYNGDYIIKDTTISTARTNYGNLIIKNTTINAKITNKGNLTICDDVVLGSSFTLVNTGNLTSNKTELADYVTIYEGNNIITGKNINVEKTNNGNLTIINSNINAKITNNGNLTLSNDISNPSFDIVNNGNLILDNLTINTIIRNYGSITIGNNVTYGDNFLITISDNVITNGTTNIASHLVVLNGDYTIGNTTDTSSHDNYGILTYINSTITGAIRNYGSIIFKNSTINSRIQSTSGTLTFEDDVIFGSNFALIGNAQIIINDVNKIVPYMNIYSGDYLIENLTISQEKTNTKNLTIRNSILNAKFTNEGNLTIENSTINQISNTGIVTIINSTINNTLENNGILIIGDNIIIGSKCLITGSGKVIADNINEIFPYINTFAGEAVIELGNYNKPIQNSGNLTIENSTLSENIFNWQNGYLTLKNSTIMTYVQNMGILECLNSTLNNTIVNTGTLIISDDTIIGENFKLQGKGSLIINDTHPAYQDLLDFVTVYSGNIVLNNKTIDAPKTNKGTLALNNCTIDSTINNMGRIIIDDDTVFGTNAKITGDGEIVINDISKILPIIDAINGNYVIEDAILTKSYIFDDMVTLINCTITNPENINYGTLILKNCTVDVGTDNTFLTNYGTVTISKDTKIIGKIDDLVDGVIDEGAPKTWVVNDRTINIYFDEDGYLTSRVNPGDTLDIRGTIKLKKSLIINKPVNIISSTKDAYIDLNTTGGSYFGENPGSCFSITKDGAYTNVTGIYFHNTQLWIYNTHHVTLDGISAVVEDQRVGSGVGQTSIRENSSYITVKNSYFYTKDNGGSSTLVLAWANYCTLENNTIVGVGEVGNLLYLTTYNVDIPQGSIVNSYNKIINNRITGPDQAAGICFGICICGYGNLVDNNTLTYSGQGIMFQWGSGVTGVEQDESLIGSGDNIVSNNKLYGGCGVEAGDIVYNNYMEGKLSVRANSTAYNNTATGLSVGPNSKAYNNTISGKVTFNAAAKDATIENNTIKGDIEIPSTVTNVTLKGNEITGSIILDGSNNKISNNRITTTGEYAVYSNKLGKNNNLTDNYMVANGKVGNDAVSLRDPSNVIASAGVATKVEVSVPGEVTVNKTVQVTVKLTDANGNPIDGQVTVSSALGSETVNVTKGTGVYQYTPKAIGEDTISVKFAGKDTFYLSSNSSNVKVVAEQQKTPVKPAAKTVVSLSFVKAPKKVSKKAKKLILSAKLKINGKLAKGKKLTFKFKGKTFKVKTNKKGVAKLTIKSKVLKKLLKKVKAGKKVKYQVSYGKKTVKKTLKVKK